MTIELKDPHKYKTIGIDAGLRYTGLAWKENGIYQTTLVENTNEIFSLVPLISANLIYEAVCKLTISEKNYIVVIEDFAFGGSFNTQQGEMIGILKYLFFSDRRCLSISFIAPNTAKKFVANNGRASKGQIKKVVTSLTGAKIATSHEADAIAILHTYYTLYSKPTEAMFRRALTDEMRR